MTAVTVLCYGDSNTHGTPPMRSLDNSDRLGPRERWPGVAAGVLGTGFTLVEEGLGGRTTVHDDPIEGASRNGKTYLSPCLDSHRPLDAIVLMLGTNDLKARFAVTPFDIANSVAALLDVIRLHAPGRDGAPVKVLLVAPAPIEEVGFLGEMFAGGAAKSRRLATFYAEVAARYGAAFLDAGTVIRVSPVDGIHFAADQHEALGRAVAERLGRMFPGR